MKDSEFVNLESNVGIPGPQLPYPVQKFCIVKYSPEKVYVIGGETEEGTYSYLPTPSINNVLIFNPMKNFTHIEGPAMIEKRNSHACALMSNSNQSKIIVVAGGLGDDYTNSLSSVEIFNSTLNTWIPGKTYTISNYKCL